MQHLVNYKVQNYLPLKLAFDQVLFTRTNELQKTIFLSHFPALYYVHILFQNIPRTSYGAASQR
jgi:hypothetical protein